jgi:hypothetical protein
MNEKQKCVVLFLISGFFDLCFSPNMVAKDDLPQEFCRFILQNFNEF